MLLHLGTSNIIALYCSDVSGAFDRVERERLRGERKQQREQEGEERDQRRSFPIFLSSLVLYQFQLDSPSNL